MKLLIEIRPGEGGMDAKLLCTTQLRVYATYAEKHNLTLSVLDDTLG